jgi:pimeloyl-ACP methyl ester carboxylesterase
MLRVLCALAALLFAAAPAAAQVEPFPPGFEIVDIPVNDTILHVRIGGEGPAVVLLHGHGDTGDMWAPLAAELARTRLVIVPDLRGMGLSFKASGGYDKKSQAADIVALLDALEIRRAAIVSHDIGAMVGFAFAAQYPQRATRLVVLDAPIPGLGPWDDLLKSPRLWHFRFGGPDMERLVAGRERIYLDHVWNTFAAHPERITEETRSHYAALYAQPGAMRADFAQFGAFDQDAADNRAFVSAGGRLNMPVLAIGGETSFGPQMAEIMRTAAVDVQEGVVPDAGHWVMEENPQATIGLVRDFIEAREAR